MISSASTIDESELARKIVYQWEEGIFLNAYILLNIYIYVCVCVCVSLCGCIYLFLIEFVMMFLC